ncbi:coenzyme A pyrophosphatase [Flavobacterium magnum]|uniref:Coenzyme A pyrophosphatase n=1 Tax=Flavobacterium magnum TaxID=2162713 RepID=A0A2S0RGA5_9FLAO|nr:CoA pyrophosphatase [Flavobacterium magnum]AWA30131.1 coenzyme A pyrophosphatase [Flavobacterium magnum]
MEFDYFLELLPKIGKVMLPGEPAHAKMSPPERRAAMETLDWNTINPRQAAVLVLFYPKGSRTHLVLILRNSYKGVHSSQIAFPGGKVESYDCSKQATALRETSEEVGVGPDFLEIVRPLSEVYIPPSNFLVAPFLAVSRTTPSFVPDPREVAGIIELPLEALFDDGNVKVKSIHTSYANNVDVPVFDFDGQIVWGATAMMLGELKEVLNNAVNG